MSKVILTGADGFIGQNLRRKLIHNWTVVPVEINDCWKFIQNFTEWDDVEFILHQGAISDTTETNIQRIYNYNIDFTLSLFEIAKAKGIPVKYASSASVYGNNFPEYNPLNYYALSKLTIDYWVKDHLEDFSLIQGFRYFNVYGLHEEKKVARNQSSPVSKFIHQAVKTGRIEIFENSDKYLRDFISVDDLIDVVINNDKGSGVYDLGTSKPVSFQHVAEVVASCYNAEIEYIPFPDHLKNKYQTYTKAKKEWGKYKFTSVENYVKNSLDKWVF